MANTGFLIQPTLKKVTNDVNEFPLDINNELCSISGLPQATMANPIDSDTYRILNTTACPVDPSDEVTLTVIGSYSELDGRFVFLATLSAPLDNDLTIGFNYTFEENGFTSVGLGQIIVINLGTTDGTTEQPYSSSATISNVVTNISLVTPNPNGTKTIIY